MSVLAVLFAAALGLNAAECDPAFSPGYFWMWNDRLEEGVLVSQLEDMRAHGLRSVCIHPFPRAFREGRFESRMSPDYLTPEYFRIYARIIRRARELGMDAWLYDEGGWPSGGANGRVVEADAEGRFRHLRLKRSSDGGVETAVGTDWRKPPYPSMIEKGATESFLRLTHEAYLKAMPEEIGKTLRFAFTDEPEMEPETDWENTGFAWTSDFDEVFRAKKGYDLRPHVRELLDRFGETDDRLAKWRIDYNEVRADLFDGRYLRPLRDWCRAHGMVSGGHLNGEDVPEYLDEYGHGDLMRSLRLMDCPGVDVIWKQLCPPTVERAATTRPFPRYAASAMHQNGGRFALSESFAIFGDACTPDQMKWLVDYQLVRGINRFVFAYYAQSNARKWMLLFEPHAGPVTPYWDYQPAFFRYIERTAAFLSSGHPGAEIAVFFDTRGLWAGGADRETAARCHYAVAEALDRLNRDYDFVNDDSLAKADVTADGALKVGAMAYRALVLPTEKWMSEAARAKVKAFRTAGGLVADGRDLAKTPETLAIRGRRGTDIRVMKRVDGKRTIYLTVNESAGPRPLTIDFRTDLPVARYDPETDRTFAVPVRDGRLDWTFGPFGSAIFVVGQEPELPRPPVRERVVAELKDGWTIRRLVSHEAGDSDFVVRSLDEQPVAANLGDWRELVGEAFCGQAVYRIEFDSETAREASVDLGKVCWCAGIRLNGRDLGKRFFGPFVWDVKLEKGRNVLEVTVANLLSSLLGDRAIRSRLAAAYPPSLAYEPHQGPSDLQNREGGLFGPVLIRE